MSDARFAHLSPLAQILLKSAESVLDDGAGGAPAPRGGTSEGGSPWCEAPPPDDAPRKLAGSPRRSVPLRAVLVCGPPKAGKTTYIVRHFLEEGRVRPFEVVNYRAFLGDHAYPLVMPERRRMGLGRALYLEYVENALARARTGDLDGFPERGAVAPDCVSGGSRREAVVVVEAPFVLRASRAALVRSVRGMLRDGDVLECRWLSYPRSLREAIRRAGYDLVKQYADYAEPPSADEGFDELWVFSVERQVLSDETRRAVDRLDARDLVTENNLLCRADLGCCAMQARAMC